MWWNHRTKHDGGNGETQHIKTSGLPRSVGLVQFLPELSKGSCGHRQAYCKIYLESQKNTSSGNSFVMEEYGGGSTFPGPGLAPAAGIESTRCWQKDRHVDQLKGVEGQM